MSPHEAQAQETREWLAKAVEDLACAVVLSGAGHEGSALFHCRQCAEKSLKAFLTWHGRPFRKTHDLKEMGQACAEIDPSLAGAIRPAHLLTEYAWKLRYPGEPYVLEEGELNQGIALARGVLLEIQRRLPVEARGEIPPDGDHE